MALYSFIIWMYANSIQLDIRVITMLSFTNKACTDNSMWKTSAQSLCFGSFPANLPSVINIYTCLAYIWCILYTYLVYINICPYLVYTWKPRPEMSSFLNSQVENWALCCADVNGETQEKLLKLSCKSNFQHNQKQMLSRQVMQLEKTQIPMQKQCIVYRE